MVKNKEFDPNQVFFIAEEDPEDHKPAHIKHNIKPTEGKFYGKLRGKSESRVDDNQQWFQPLETRNIPTSGVIENNFLVNPLNEESSEDSEDSISNKYFLFYNNKKIDVLASITDVKQLILDIMDQRDVDLDKFTLYKKIPISLELCFEEK
jgi:hypothetical protein